MEYEGMIFDVVAIGNSKAGVANRGSTTTSGTGAGAGAAGGLGFFFGFGFGLGLHRAAQAAMPQHFKQHRVIKSAHCQSSK